MSKVAVSIGPKPQPQPIGSGWLNLDETSPSQSPSQSHSPSPNGLQPDLLALDAGEQYRFGFNMNSCIGCHSCEVACAEQNGLPTGTVWRRVGELEGGEHPAARRFHLSMSCNHCLEPACLQGCPTNAYLKLDNGVVVQHADDCIGCQYCTWNCPYSVPVFQPDRRIVTKCDLCQPRLGAGLAPACVQACPTQAITVEKVDVVRWRADHAAADGPGLPNSGLTLSTTRIELPVDLPMGTLAASDWNVRPEHPHWSLVWLTLVSQLAVGMTVAANSAGERLGSAALAALALIGALFHLGRPAMAYKALRNLRHSWLSREVALLSLFGALAPAAAVAPQLQIPASVVGLAGVFASARLYVVPGRPAWNSPLTIVRFMATAAALGAAVTGPPLAVVMALVVAVGATATNWARAWRDPEPALKAARQLETRHFRGYTLLRIATAILAGIAAMVGAPVAVVFGLAAVSELIGRWLFYVCVVPLNMPGGFWRGTGGSHR